MSFISRQDAGEILGRYLLEQGVTADIVVGLPRGGVVVAAAVAQILSLPLDVLVVRKIGHPHYREFAVGAIAEGPVIMVDESCFGNDPQVRTGLNLVIAEESARLKHNVELFHQGRELELEGKTILLVDDGLATGATMRVALQSARCHHAHRCIVAVPVAATSTVKALAHQADQIVTLISDPDFAAVGGYYQQFDQTSDEEVLALLHPAVPL